MREQWSALAQLAALHGVLPGQVSSAQLDSGGDALLTAFARPGHPKAGHKLRSALVRLRATLFHAGMTDTPPRLHRPNRGVVATAQWAAVAPGLTKTAQRYLAQLELSLRPSTVRIAEQVLREFTAFLAREAPGVSLRRRHRPPPHRGLQVLARQPPPSRWRHPAPPHHPRAPHDAAVLLRPDHRMGLSRRADAPADLRR